MTEQRLIDMQLDAVTKTKIAEITGQDKLNAAIGYLAGWNMSLPHATISGGVFDGNPELLATYRSGKNVSDCYVIGAVWHGDHFGFHS